MSVEFRIVRGARSGSQERFEKSVVSIGRHPMNDLRFDANKDADASSRHAEVRSVAGRHVIHDLGSTNGTYVNGERINAEQELADGDLISFGVDGPQVSFHVLTAAEAAVAPATRVGGTTPREAQLGAPVAPLKVAATPHKPVAPPVVPPRKNTEVRIAEAVHKQTGRLKQMVLGLAVFVIAGGAIAVWFAMQAAESQRRQFATLIAANDSLARALEQRLEQTGVADAALRAARVESQRLARDLRAMQESGGDISALSAEMRTAQIRTSTIARMDYSAVTAANKAAIVFIAVQFPDGPPSSGTGFNLLASGLIVTNKHVIRSKSGARAEQVAVAFDGTTGAWKEATVEYVSETDELAILRLVRPGNYPVVGGVAREARDVKIGDPVAILGYPLGTSTAGMSGNIDNLRPEATLGVGTISKILDDVIQLDAFAAQGSSGSPIFDARGLVVGVLYGAAAESGGRIIYCVPAARLAVQLPRDAAGVLR